MNIQGHTGTRPGHRSHSVVNGRRPWFRGAGAPIGQTLPSRSWGRKSAPTLGAAAFLGLVAYTVLANRGDTSAMLASPIKISSGTITSSLGALLDSHGLSSAEIAGVSSAMRKNLDLRRLTADDEYSIIFSSSSVLKYMYVQKGLKRHFAFRNADGSFSGAVKPVLTSCIISRSSATLSSSLWESMLAQGTPPSVILDFADVFSWSIDFLTEVREGDRVEAVYDSVLTPTGRAVSHRLLAGRYAGRETGIKTAFYFKGGYYDEKGGSVRGLFLRAPLQYRRISSYFSRARRHPVLKIVRPHLGIDYAAPRGTPVSSVADGTVIFAGRKGGYGNYIEVRHESGYRTTYGHLQNFAKGIRAGKKVRQGDLIGYVGSTGLSTGPHLDFRIKENGRFMNFLQIKHRSGAGVAARFRKEFLAAARQILPPLSENRDPDEGGRS